jgi:hypothetical protein
MTDQELQAAQASQADWYARAEARGVTADHVRPGVELDTWAALNPGADWAAGEDNAARWTQEMKDAEAAQAADADAAVA